MNNVKSCGPGIRNVKFVICNFRGFTLLEIMIALAIIGISVTVILHTVNYHADVMYDNNVTTQMYQLAKEKMNGLETTPKSAKGDIGETGFQFENKVYTQEDSNLIELNTTIKGNNKEVTLREIIINRQVEG